MSPNSVFRTEATATELLALTMPPKQPRGCGPHWTRTTVFSIDADSTAAIPILVSEAVLSCYPSGWENILPKSGFYISASQCPGGWNAYRLGPDAGTVSSMAICCNSGYAYLNKNDYELVTSASISTHKCGHWVHNTDDQIEAADMGEDMPDFYV